MSTTKIILALVAVIPLIVPLIAQAVPPQVAETFHGNVMINERAAPPGTDIVVFSNGKICGRYTVRTEGKYGLMACNDQNLRDVRFEVNGESAEATYVSKGRVDLSARIFGYWMPEGIEIGALLSFILLIAYLIVREERKRI